MRVHRISWIAFSFAALAALAAGDEARGEVPRGHFTNAINLGSNVNSESADNAPDISADGLTLYFNSTRSGGLGGYDLYQATRSTVDEPFGHVMTLGPDVNSSETDGSSVISFDDLTLYFLSFRSGGEGGQDIYQATRPTVNDPFGDVMNLGAINTAFDERPGHISPDGLTLYFDSNRPGGQGNYDLYTATRETLSDRFSNVTNLGSGINGPTDDVGASVSTDGLTLFFSDRFAAPFRPGGQGDPDLWVAVRTSTDDPFGDVVNLDSFSLGSDVNTPSNEWNPMISDDWPAFGSQLYFQSTRPGSRSLDLWQATWVPEPSGVVLAAVGLLSAIGYGRRRGN